MVCSLGAGQQKLTSSEVMQSAEAKKGLPGWLHCLIIKKIMELAFKFQLMNG